MKNYNIKSLVDSNKEILSISTQGWVRNKRTGKNISFINLNDGSVLSGIQIILEHNKNTEEEIRKLLKDRDNITKIEWIRQEIPDWEK